MKTEYIKSLHNNYERIKLEDPVQESRYQYCILGRGGIRGLLPCSLRYVNGDSYLYYDITSLQTVAQVFRKKTISRQWLKEFGEAIKGIQTELSRFLLDETCLIWNPETLYQDLGTGELRFLYMPYYNGENGFSQLLEFLVERVDYTDDGLVECVYGMYEQYSESGEAYLKEKIFADIEGLEEMMLPNEEGGIIEEPEPLTEQLSLEDIAQRQEQRNEEYRKRKGHLWDFLLPGKKTRQNLPMVAEAGAYYRTGSSSQGDTDLIFDSGDSHNAGDEFDYSSDRTIYIENIAEEGTPVRRLFAEDGKILMEIRSTTILIGKKAGEADLVLGDESVSRMHARIMEEEGEFYLEDLNSTNGTFRNGIRLQPYEQQQLHPEDEIRLGATRLIFR